MSKHNLKISNQLSLPIDAATQTFAFIARKGAGKTYAAGKLVELLMDARVQVVILDAVGNWYGLRLDAGGKGKGFDIPVLGGLRGDIPLEAAGGDLIADIITESGRSIILDISQFSKADRQRFATSLGERLWLRKKAERHPAPLHMVIEESQLIIPEQPGGDSARMVGIYEEIIRLGRNYGIGVSMITQRPQSVNKEVLNQTECLFVGQLNGSQERAALKKWITHQGMDVHLVDELPGLPIGTFYVWSPQWLQILKKIEISPKQTFDGSATPKVGQTRVRREIKPLDLADLKEKLKATIEKQKADDPRELRKQIVALRAALKKAHAQPSAPEAVKEKRVEVKVLKDEQLKRAESMVGRLTDAMNKMQQLATAVKDATAQVAAAIGMTKAPMPASSIARTVPAHQLPKTMHRAVASTVNGDAALATRRAQTREVDDVGGERPDYTSRDQLSGPMRKVVDAYAWWHSIGVAQPSRENIAPVAGYSHVRSRGFTNPLYALNAAGLIEDNALTEKGLALASSPDGVDSLDDYHEKLKKVLAGPAQKLFEQIHALGGATNRDELASACGYQHVRSRGFTVPLYRISSMGLVDLEKNGIIQATELFYPPSLIGADASTAKR